MGVLKFVDFKATRWLANSSPSIYNIARWLRCFFDKIYIDWSIYKNKPFVLIYQQGRVASTSVYESVCAVNLPYPVFHVHTVSAQRAQKRIAMAKKNKTRVDRNLVVGRLVGEAIERNKGKNGSEPWKVISIFRDPISIIMSLHFMNIDRHLQGVSTGNGRIDKMAVMQHFERLFANDDPSGWAIVNWFDDVFLEELGVDVYSHQFEYKKGYTIINDLRFNILLLKFENLASAFKYGAAKLLNVESQRLNLLHSNIHRDRRYDEVHKYVKKNFKLSRSICEKVYSTKFMKHFYSEDEIEELIRKWSKVG